MNAINTNIAATAIKYTQQMSARYTQCLRIVKAVKVHVTYARLWH